MRIDFKRINKWVLRLKGWRPIALVYTMSLGLYLCSVLCLEYSSCFHICPENAYITKYLPGSLFCIHSFLYTTYPENTPFISHFSALSRHLSP